MAAERQTRSDIEQETLSRHFRSTSTYSLDSHSDGVSSTFYSTRSRIGADRGESISSHDIGPLDSTRRFYRVDEDEGGGERRPDSRADSQRRWTHLSGSESEGEGHSRLGYGNYQKPKRRSGNSMSSLGNVSSSPHTQQAIALRPRATGPGFAIVRQQPATRTSLTQRGPVVTRSPIVPPISPLPSPPALVALPNPPRHPHPLIGSEEESESSVGHLVENPSVPEGVLFMNTLLPNHPLSIQAVTSQQNITVPEAFQSKPLFPRQKSPSLPPTPTISVLAGAVGGRRSSSASHGRRNRRSSHTSGSSHTLTPAHTRTRFASQDALPQVTEHTAIARARSRSMSFKSSLHAPLPARPLSATTSAMSSKPSQGSLSSAPPSHDDTFITLPQSSGDEKRSIKIVPEQIQRNTRDAHIKMNSFSMSLQTRQHSTAPPPALHLRAPAHSSSDVILETEEKVSFPKKISMRLKNQSSVIEMGDQINIDESTWPKRELKDSLGRSLKVWEASSVRKKIRASPLSSLRLVFFPLEGQDRPTSFIICLFIHLGICAFWGAAIPMQLIKVDLISRGSSIALISLFAYFYLISLTSMLKTSFADPGFLPARLDPEPEWEWTGEERVARPKTVRMDGFRVDTKWCSTCQSYRSVRCSHCKVCDACTDGIDHHCTFLNNCIGRLNYGSFFVFLTSTTIALLLSLAQSFLILSNPPSWSENLKRYPYILILAIISLAVLTPILILYSYHIRLIFLGKSTIELIREGAAKRLTLSSGVPVLDPNAGFRHGSVGRNFLFAICRPADLNSYIKWEEAATEDIRADNPWWQEENAHGYSREPRHPIQSLGSALSKETC